MKQWRRHCWTLLCAHLLTATQGWAEPDAPATRVSLDFEAPGDCATVAAFKRRVALRSERIAWVSEPPRAGTAKVSLDRTPSGVRVRLAWTRANEGATIREFSAPNCEEATDAAALIIAITFDPTAPNTTPAAAPNTPAPRTSPQDTRAAQSTTKPDKRKAPRSTGETSSADEEEEDVGETQPLDIPATDAGALSSTPRTRTPRSVGGGATVLVEGISGVAPAPMLGFGVSAGVAWGRGILAPELRLMFVHFLGLTYPSHGGDSHFELDGAKLLACPIRLGPDAFALRPCAFGFGGRLGASGRDTINPQSHSRPFWLLGGSLVAVYRPASVLLFMGDISLGAPLVRDSFQFAPEQFHQVEQTVLSAGFAVGLQYP